MVGDPVELDIEALIWDPDIEEHLARHWVTPRNLLAVVDGSPLTYENLPNRAGSHIMIGPDDLGRILYVSIRETDVDGVWEPVTAWESRFARHLWLAERGGA